MITTRRKGQTVVAVAHRLSTIRTADQIIVVGAEGDIEECGSWDALVAQKGRFFEFVKAQDLSRNQSQTSNGPSETGDDDDDDDDANHGEVDDGNLTLSSGASASAHWRTLRQKLHTIQRFKHAAKPVFDPSPVTVQVAIDCLSSVELCSTYEMPERVNAALETTRRELCRFRDRACYHRAELRTMRPLGLLHDGGDREADGQLILPPPVGRNITM
jgi:hypothetical protein